MVEAVVISAKETPAEAPADTNANKDTNRPAWLPEKFKSPEDLAKSYAELEAKVGKPADQQTPEQKAAADKAATDKATADAKAASDAKAAEDAAKAAQVDLPAYEQKFLANGKLDDADYAALAAKGFTKDVVDGFIAYRSTQAQALATETFNLAGGPDQFKVMAEWAGKGGYTKEQSEAFNRETASGDKDRMQNAVKALAADFAKKKGLPPPNPLTASTGGKPGEGDVYTSLTQMLADQASPKYRSDPAERARVMAKLTRSKI